VSSQALSKPAFGFTLDSWRYRERAGETDRDELGHTVEDFEMSDNLEGK